jgi:AAA ATPase domain
MPLVGRDAQQADLRDLLEQARTGRGALAVVTGPPGVGRTALLDWVAEHGTAAGFPVLRAAGSPGRAGRLVWARLLRESGDEAGARVLLDPTDPLELDDAVGRLVSGPPRLLVVDDIDQAGQPALELLELVASRLAGSRTAVVVSAAGPLDVGSELPLTGLSRAEFDELLADPGDLGDELVDTAWIASRGLPRAGRRLARDLRGLPPGADPIVHLALGAVSGTFFLEVDHELVRLLERAAARAVAPADRARLRARLARELLGEPASLARRRRLIAEALELAEQAGEPGVRAEILDARLHALWDPAGAHDRARTGEQIMTLAAAAGDEPRERQGLFWCFVAAMELADLPAAEAALARHLQMSRSAGDGAAVTMGVARQAMLAVLHGRFEEARALIDEVRELGHRARVADVEPLAATLMGGIGRYRGDPALWQGFIDRLTTAARWAPGHFYQASIARLYLFLDRPKDAETELLRLLPRLLAGTGPRWLAAAGDLAVVAAAVGNRRAAAELYAVLAPLDGQLVTQGGANLCTEPVAYGLGLLADVAGRTDAVHHLDDALAMAQRLGALPATADIAAALAAALSRRRGPEDVDRARALLEQARTLADRLGLARTFGAVAGSADEWVLTRDGADWTLSAGAESARLRDGRGLHYLRALLAAPGREILALDLVAGGAGLAEDTGTPALDDAAVAAYRRRLADLDGELAAADRQGDAGRAARLQAERDAVVAELRAGTGLGGRRRLMSHEGERARVSVTRALRRALGSIAEVAPLCAAHLEASVRTGRACRYAPDGSGPRAWRV